MQYRMYEVPGWFFAPGAVASAVAIVVAIKQAWRLDWGSPRRAVRRMFVRARWASVSRSCGLAVAKDRKRVLAGHGPSLVAVLTGSLDRAPTGGAGVERRPVERLPKLAHGRGSVDKLVVRYKLVPPRGSSVEAVADRHVELADGLHLPRVSIRRTGAAKGELVAFLGDPLAQVTPWRRLDLPNALAWGLDEDGAVVRFPLGVGSMLVGGSVGSGKSSLVNALMASAAYRPDVAFVGFDMKIVELAPWAPRMSAVATDHNQAADLLDRLADEVVRRFRALEQSGLRRLTEATPDMPWLLVVLDEAAELVGGIDRGRLVSVARLGRAAGVHLVVCTQRPSAEAISTDVRDQCGWRVAFRLPNPDTAAMIVGREYAGEPVAIPLGAPGVCVTVDDRAPVRRARAWWVSDAEVERIAAETAHLRVRLPWLEGGAR